MKFFVDTADVAEIKDLAATGLLDGVTTNPSLVAKAGRDFKEIVAEICKIVPGPVSAEVAATDYAGMMVEAEVLRKIAKNVTIKVPLTMDGLRACKALTGDGTMVNVTLCFSANQALLAAKAGATFVSPFIGRLDDIGLNGMDVHFIGSATDDLSPFNEFSTTAGAPLKQTMSLISGASLFVGNESGPAHIAAAYGVPQVIIFGNSDATIWKPWRTRAEIVIAKESISGIGTEQVRKAIAKVRTIA